MLAVIVRFHSPARAFELRRAIFSLVGQSYRPLTILLVTQRFTAEQLRLLREELSSTLSLDESVNFKIENYDKELPRDARSALISLGMQVATERYLAMLDHDDVILPHGYASLIEELSSSGAAIAFGSVAAKEVDIFHDLVLVEARREIFRGKTLCDLLNENFCPIHSFVIDRSKMDPEDLWFDETLSKGEDYEFLLRICSKYPASFALRGTFVGDYYFKSDGSNTIGVPWQMTAEGLDDWDRANEYLEKRKAEILLSPLAQRDLGISSFDPALTIKRFLDEHQGAK